MSFTPEIIFNFVMRAALCVLPHIGLWIIITRTPLIQHLIEWFSTHEPMTRDDVQQWLGGRQMWIALGLYCCVWCQAFWTTLLSAALYSFVFGVWWELPFWTLTFLPINTYIIWKIAQLETH